MPITTTSGLVPVLIALPRPGSRVVSPRPDRIRTGASLRPRTSALTDGTIDWNRPGVQPRWLMEESYDCAAVLEPAFTFNQGDAELDRYFEGAVRRGECAVLVSTVGNADSDVMPSPGQIWDTTRILPPLRQSVHGRRLPAGVQPRLATDLEQADRDLGLRLMSAGERAVWWELGMAPVTRQWQIGTPLPSAPAGELHPILVDGPGRPVAAVWVAEDRSLRWYFLPDKADWLAVIDWLTSTALPSFAPTTMRRVRHHAFIDPDLETRAERDVRSQLTTLEQDYARRKAALEAQLQLATEKADPVRSGLLYGTGDELADAVALVLADAGLTVADLDRELGATESADLLVQYGTSRRLVEVKSAGGNASEKLADFLRKHLETWPSLRPDLPVTGGTLIVNHQHKTEPQERTKHIYDRKAFIETLPFPVVSTRDLFTWWRRENWEALRNAVLGSR